MRFLLPFLCFILCCSCHNKSDLERIAELEKENVELKEKLGPKLFDDAYKYAEKNILDSILLGITIEDRMLGCYLAQYYTYNNTSSKSIRLNKDEYKTDIHLAERTPEDYFDSIYYSLPSKYFTRYNSANDLDKMMKAKKNFTFVPKDTGWYYSYIIVPIKNNRTGVVRLYPITDSFYVYK